MSEADICVGFFRHKMDTLAGSGRKVQFGIPVYWRCDRCGTERTDIFSVTGKLISQKYWHPDEYKELLADARGLNRETKKVKAFKAMRKYSQ